MGAKLGIVAVLALGLALILAGLATLFLGQNINPIELWVIVIIISFVLLVIGIHLTLASILTYLRVVRKRIEK